MAWDGVDRRAATPDWHDDIVKLATRLETALNIYKFWAVLIIPAICGYIVYEHLALEKISAELATVTALVTGINEHGSKFLISKSQRDHYGQGCHFKAKGD